MGMPNTQPTSEAATHASVHSSRSDAMSTSLRFAAAHPDLELVGEAGAVELSIPQIDASRIPVEGLDDLVALDERP